MLAMVNQEDISFSTNNITNYIKSNNLNYSFAIADMQSTLNDTTVTFSKKYNLFTNLAKVAFIGVTTIFCGIAFKQVYSARLMLENFVNQVGVHTNNNIVFHLKNGAVISCSNIITCINNLNFEQIVINNQQINKLLSSDRGAIVANVLGGISISSEAAVIILTLIDSSIKLLKNNLYKKALTKAYLKNNNLLPYLFCIVTIPPFYYGIKNITDTYDIVEKYDRFLTSVGKDQLLTTQQAIIISISCVATTFGSRILFVANIPRAITYLIRKIFR